MKIRNCAVFLLAVLLVIPLSGCSLWTLDARLEALGEKVENRMDAAEDAAEAAIMQALIPTAPVAVGKPKETAPAASLPSAAQDPSRQLTAQEAEAIALAHSGFAASQVNYLRTEYEIDDGIPQYDIQFQNGRWEYEYELHAETGQILSFDKDD